MSNSDRCLGDFPWCCFSSSIRIFSICTITGLKPFITGRYRCIEKLQIREKLTQKSQQESSFYSKYVLRI